MIRFIFLFLSLGCSYSFAETNYRKEVENFAKTLIFDKYEQQFQPKKGERVVVNASTLDKRITYPRCQKKLQGSIVGNKLKRNNSIKITCADPQGWTIYLRTRTSVMVNSIAAKSALSKGQVLNKHNIHLIEVDKSQVKNGSFSVLSSLYGSRLKRNISVNRVIKNRDICVVCKSDKVTIHALKSGLSIKASGIALNDANIGGTVRVKNSRTKRIVVGTVTALKEVQVSF